MASKQILRALQRYRDAVVALEEHTGKKHKPHVYQRYIDRRYKSWDRVLRLTAGRSEYSDLLNQALEEGLQVALSIIREQSDEFRKKYGLS